MGIHSSCTMDAVSYTHLDVYKRQVWKLKDTYKAMFEIDSQTMAASASSTGNANQISIGNAVANRMNAFENFVKIQSDAALRQVAGQYAYDDNEANTEELTLRSGGEEINEQLEQKLNERLAMAGMEVVESLSLIHI